jgi:hypothetical protein
LNSAAAFPRAILSARMHFDARFQTARRGFDARFDQRNHIDARFKQRGGIPPRDLNGAAAFRRAI